MANIYEEMVNAKFHYQQKYLELTQSVQNFFSEYIEDMENARIFINEYDFVIVRSSEKMENETIEKFCDEYGCSLMWNKSETMNDVSNAEPCTVAIYEYAFLLRRKDDEK
jgi:hypothetical protein